MTSSTGELPRSSSSGDAAVGQVVTVIMGIVVGLTFIFGFVLNLALRLGCASLGFSPRRPAVDLSILGLIFGIRQLTPGRVDTRATAASSLTVDLRQRGHLALNVADPLVAGQHGKAAFDAVGPSLLIGGAALGPDLLRALAAAGRLDEAKVRRREAGGGMVRRRTDPYRAGGVGVAPVRQTRPNGVPADGHSDCAASGVVDDDLLGRTMAADARHWEEHRRPISAETARSASVHLNN